MHEPHRFRTVRPDGRSGGSGRPNPPSRRTLLRSAAAGGLAAAGIVTGAPGAAATSRVTGSKVRDLSGPAPTGRFAAPWTDLGIPVRCPDGSMPTWLNMSPLDIRAQIFATTTSISWSASGTTPRTTGSCSIG